MIATAAASEMASELGERIRHAGEQQLKKLEALTHAKGSPKKAKQGFRMGKLSILVLIAGLGYGLYKVMRPSEPKDMRFERDVPVRGAQPETVRAAAARTA